MTRSKISEANVKQAIYHYLTIKKYFWWPSKVVGIWDAKIQARRKDPWLRPGVSDILLLRDGVLYAIELKGSHGRAGIAQREFEAQIKAEGGRYILARSIEDLERAGL